MPALKRNASTSVNDAVKLSRCSIGGAPGAKNRTLTGESACIRQRYALLLKLVQLGVDVDVATQRRNIRRYKIERAI